MRPAPPVDSTFSVPADLNMTASRFSRLRIALHRLRREPMVHFVAFGAIIFLVSHAVENARVSAEKTITVDTALQQRLSKLYELQMGAAPSPSQLTQMTDGYIHDEVLYREGLALGLDKGDEIIRRRLVQKMGFLQNDLTILPEPDEKALHHYYQQHAAQFVEPTRVSFQQLFFSADNDAADAVYQRATQTRDRLNTNAAANVEADRSPLAANYQQLDQSELERIFGVTPIVERLLNTAQGTWVGPVRSGYGWHLIKIDERIERRALSFDAARKQVGDAVKEQQKQESNQSKFRKLLAQYEIRKTAESAQP